MPSALLKGHRQGVSVSEQGFSLRKVETRSESREGGGMPLFNSRGDMGKDMPKGWCILIGIPGKTFSHSDARARFTDGLGCSRVIPLLPYLGAGGGGVNMTARACRVGYVHMSVEPPCTGDVFKRNTGDDVVKGVHLTRRRSPLSSLHERPGMGQRRTRSRQALHSVWPHSRVFGLERGEGL